MVIAPDEQVVPCIGTVYECVCVCVNADLCGKSALSGR